MVWAMVVGVGVQFAWSRGGRGGRMTAVEKEARY